MPAGWKSYRDEQAKGIELPWRLHRPEQLHHRRALSAATVWRILTSVYDEGDGLASGATGASGKGDSRDATDLTHKRSDEEVDDRSLSRNPPMGEELEEGDPVINMLVSGIVGLVLLALAVIVRFTMAGGHR